MIYFGIIGAGGIARKFLDAVRQTTEGEVNEVIQCIKNGQLESSVCPHEMTLDAAMWIDKVLQSN